MKVFLDDERQTPAGWHRTYTVEETLSILATKQVEELSLDNDLGEGLAEGFVVLNTLEEWVFFDPTFPLPIINVHSSNAGRTPSMRQIIAKLEIVRRQQKNVCTCDSEYIAPHSCPFKAEIKNDDKTLCTCCKKCRHECVMDV